MTTLIGITQYPEQTENFCAKEFKMLGTRTVVGPFRSADQAEGWVKFMQSRPGEFRPIPDAAPVAVQDRWYGVAFELAGSETQQR